MELINILLVQEILGGLYTDQDLTYSVDIKTTVASSERNPTCVKLGLIDSDDSLNATNIYYR